MVALFHTYLSNKLIFFSIEEHHHTEEKIYFPWIKERTEFPEKQFSMEHKEMVKEMEKMKDACEIICKKGGKGCGKEIAILKNTIPTFEKDMRDHLREEEQTIPSLLRANFTQEEEGEIVEKILASGGLTMTKKFLPPVLLAMQEWGRPEFYDEFCASMPPPIRHLAFKVSVCY